MTAADLVQFEAEAARRFQWGKMDVAKALDVSHDRYLRMRRGGRIPEHIALACNAILLGIPPYPEPAQEIIWNVPR